MRIRHKGPVSDAFDMKFLRTQPEAFSIHNDPRPGRNGGCHGLYFAWRSIPSRSRVLASSKLNWERLLL